MRKFWYRRILIMILVLSVSVGGSYCLLQLQQSNLEREVAAEPSDHGNPRRNAGGNLSGDRWGYGAWNRGGRR